MKNFVQHGDTITLIAPYVRVSGEGALVGSLFGLAVDDVASGAEGEFAVAGVFDITKEGVAIAAGQLVYWDDTNKRVTPTASGNKLVGVGSKAAASGDATGRVRLNGTMLPQVFVSTEQTGTGSSQSIAHGLGVTPSKVFVSPTDTAPATVGVYTATEGTHTATNVLVTVTSGKKYKVIAIV